MRKNRQGTEDDLGRLVHDLTLVLRLTPEDLHLSVHTPTGQGNRTRLYNIEDRTGTRIFMTSVPANRLTDMIEAAMAVISYERGRR